ncbi:hypothetical protein O179_04360 [Chlamydia trachomatis]|nr:hypothetical protein E150_04165 [Chlamydia trachomatis E/150]ADH21274.1 hypothetical protein E11023_04130 [Chlamydia trachomatis E/11023]AGT64916.1 hypothetical protein O169_04370 [Chlamydia trachomatis]AGT67699.1 hypothetical protein O173_04360 [Chlamydia trachomatis F/11-96]AGT65844.1 hypothetical protein O170_04355 [Chlamydia trachomatis]
MFPLSDFQERENDPVFSFYFGESKLHILSLQNFSSLM